MVRDRDIRAYALSHLGKSLLWTGADALTIFLLIRHVGMTPGAAGAVFMAMMLWNALCDALVGRWLDRRGGTPMARRAVAAAVPVACLAFPAGLLIADGIGWVLACGLVFRTAFALFDVPHNALIAQLADTPERGLDLARLRSLGSGLASILIGLLAAPMLTGTPPSGLLTAGLLLLLAAVSCALMIPYLTLTTRLDRQPAAAGPSPRSPVAPGLVPLFLASAIGMVAMGALSKAAPHLDLSSVAWGSTALLILMVGRVAAIAVAGPVVARLGAHRTLTAAYGGMAVCAVGLPPAMMAGGVFALAWIGLTGLAIGLVALTSWIRLPALVRDGERGRAFTFGLFTMTSKVALGVSGLLLALAFGEPPDGGLEGVISMPGLVRLGLAAAAVSALAALVLSVRRRATAATTAASG